MQDLYTIKGKIALKDITFLNNWMTSHAYELDH